MERMERFPPLFLERMRRFLGDEYPLFYQSLSAPPQNGLRVNTLKLSAEAFARISPFTLESGIPWCPSAFLVAAEDRPGKHPFHLAGLYYLQEPSAMAVAESLAPRPGERVLDLAASPGGKTTHLASLMQGEGLLIANEIKEKRLGQLVMNVERWGAPNVIVTNESPERLVSHFGDTFDRVLLDAPCSGEGMFRKDPQAPSYWSEAMIEGCAARQIVLLRLAARLVRPGGWLLYSTCTFAPEENEGVIAQFLEEHPHFTLLPLPRVEGAMGGRPDWLPRPVSASIAAALEGALRLFPHRLPAEGHFLCLLQRKDAPSSAHIPVATPAAALSSLQRRLWQEFAAQVFSPSSRLNESSHLFVWGERLYFSPFPLPPLEGLRHVNRGLWVGSFKKNRFEPSHALALFLRPQEVQQVVDFPAQSAEIAAYLRGEPLPSAGSDGWVLVCVEGWPLGWGKRVQGILKNHYPRHWLRTL
jgi:NOL1/NOP2/sun family putative RNA methylase